MAKYKVSVDRDACIGDGVCESLCPEVFKLDDEGISVVLKPEIDDSLYDCVKQAVESCPAECISLEKVED